MTDFHEVLLDPTIAKGAQGGPSGWKTSVVVKASGFEQRNIEWSKARGRWNIGYGIKEAADFRAIQKFHFARGGMAHGFRFKDWTDYEADEELLIASAVGGETTAQLVKTYSDSAGSYIRTIQKPVATGFQLYINGSPVASSLNTVTGVVTFSALTAADVVRWSGQFHVPVRFADDHLSALIQDEDIIEVPDIVLVELRLNSAGQG